MGGILGAAAVGIGSGLIGKALDKGPPKVDRSRIPTGIYTAGLNARPVSSGQVRVDLTPERKAMGERGAGVRFDEADSLAALRKDLGRSGLVDAGLARFRAARDRAQSTLRSNLAKRKVLGSSFASNTLGATDLDFAQQEALFASEQKLIETQQKVDLIQREASARSEGYKQLINDLDLPTEVGLRLQGAMSQVESTLARVDAQMVSEHRGGALELGLTGFREALQYGLGQQAISMFGQSPSFSPAVGSAGRYGYSPPVNPVVPGRVSIYGLASAPPGPSLSGSPLLRGY